MKDLFLQREWFHLNININDKPTLANLLSVTIPENSGEGTLLGTITYNDEDSQQTVTFMLAGQTLGTDIRLQLLVSRGKLNGFDFSISTTESNIDVVFELSLTSDKQFLHFKV